LRFYRSCVRFLWVFKFSLVFCRFGGRFEASLYIHSTRRWVEARRHSPASREGEDEKKAKKNAILRSWALRGRIVSRVGLRRLMEEARRAAPDLLGLDRSRQYVAWRATDVSTVKKLIAAATAHSWQLAWYFSLLGEPKSFSGSASVAREGIKLAVTAYWPREREGQILRESRWLKSLLGRIVNNWRELVDVIDWRWVLKKVEELADELKSWIGPEMMGDVEREGLARRMLGELALLVHFAKTRRGMDDRRWREERAKRLRRRWRR
jgi:hypothetical protein